MNPPTPPAPGSVAELDNFWARTRIGSVLAERERLAQEIHDGLAQIFTSILTLSQTTEVVLPAEATDTRERLTLIERAARDGLTESRALVGALGPVDLLDASLAEAVERVVARFGTETGVSTAPTRQRGS